MLVFHLCYFQAHDSVLKNHSYAPFDDYQELPTKYERPYCSEHQRPLSLACESCDMIVCEECDLMSDCDGQLTRGTNLHFAFMLHCVCCKKSLHLKLFNVSTCENNL